MNYQTYSRLVVDELRDCLEHVDKARLELLAEEIARAPRVFCDGLGRSGLQSRAFAMRLTHLGKNAYVVSETTTPSIACGDLLILCSGSGETDSLVVHAQKAKAVGVKVCLMTASVKSTIQQTSDLCVCIPANTKQQIGDTSIQPMGTLFEQSLGIVFDVLVLQLMDRMGVSPEEMYRRHKNLE